MKEKTYVEDIDRSIYDVKDEERDAYKVDKGLTEAIVEQISRGKKGSAVDGTVPASGAADLQ